MSYIKNNIDLLGMAGSILCAIHCSALPILLAMGSLSSVAWLDSHWVEYLFLGSALILAGWSLVGSYSHHGKPWAIALAIIGFIVFFIGFAEHNHTEIGLTTLGGVLIALSHFVNWRMMKKTSCIAA